MSGHSHARTVKHQKEASTLKRGQTFSKMIRLINIAVKESGPDPEVNSKLKMVIERAKSFNMPKDNIERAIKLASGDKGELNFQEVIFEAYGPGSIAIIIEGITDNKNRTLNLIKQAMNQGGGKLAQEGAVKWMFDRKGVVFADKNQQAEGLNTKEALEMAAIEAGALDFRWINESEIEIYTKPEEITIVKNSLEGKGIKAESVSLDWVPKDRIKLNDQDKATAEKLFDLLDEIEDVQDTFSNSED